jgi:hypothetical protein
MDYWLVETKDGDTGINGGLMPRRNPGQPFHELHPGRLHRRRYGKCRRRRRPVALPKTEIGPGWGFIAAFKDTEGNLLGFHQSPKSRA